MNSGGVSPPKRTRVKPWGEDLMPLSLAIRVFQRSERTFWYMRKRGCVEIVTLMCAAYVSLKTLRAHLGDSTYEFCMRRAPTYNEETGWQEPETPGAPANPNDPN